MNDACIIFQKELRNFFKDRRTLFSTFLLPLLLLPILFIGMGTVINALEADAQKTTYHIAIEGVEDARLHIVLKEVLNYTIVESADADVSIVFPPGYAPGISSSVVISYDSSSQKLQYAHQQVLIALQRYQEILGEQLLNLHGLTTSDLHSLDLRSIDRASQAVQSGGSVLAMLVPYFLLIFLFSGSINAGLDTTCGEKERGSLAILLVNQVPRTSIAWGKICYVSVVAICSAGATFLGLLIAMLSPGGADLFSSNALGAGAISLSALLTIIIVLFAAALFTGSIVALLGSLARSVKEGTTYVMPLYMLVILIGVITMYMDPTQNGWFFFIPMVNTIFVMKEIFMGMVTPWHVLVTVLSQIGVSGICAYLVARLFNSEKILQTV